MSFKGKANTGMSFTVQVMWAETVNPFMSLIVPHLKETAAHLLFHTRGEYIMNLPAPTKQREDFTE